MCLVVILVLFFFVVKCSEIFPVYPDAARDLSGSSFSHIFFPLSLFSSLDCVKTNPTCPVSITNAATLGCVPISVASDIPEVLLDLHNGDTYALLTEMRVKKAVKGCI